MSLNKLDLATQAEREAARAIVMSLNAGARIIETTDARVPLDQILDTGLFSFEAAHAHPTWYMELNGFKDHTRPRSTASQASPSGRAPRSTR